MNFELKTLSLAAASSSACDLLVLPLAEGAAAKLQADTSALAQWAGAALAQGDITTKAKEQLHGYQVAGVKARRVLLLGTGQGSGRELTSALQSAAAYFKAAGVRHAVLCLSALPQPDVAQAVQTLQQALYQYQHTKTAAADQSAPPRVTLGVAQKRSASAAFEQGLAIAAGQTLAKEWGNRPANHATPTHLAAVAQDLAKAPRMRCKIHGPKEVAKLGMGAFLAVAQGSREPLQLIELHYQGAGKNDAPVVLVGKGITFDTGGISIKPAAAMDEMKFDMCGAASVLGTFAALAQLQPAINVVGIIPACENMPDGAAVKPGDVVTSMSGQTIEILNTDAEGRLVLCDALTYAQRFAPAAIVDIATLTGACVIALGGVRSGMYASEDVLAAQLQAAGQAAHDPCWRMPLDDEYAEGLKSNFADVANVAGRAGGSITAAKFLQRFAGSAPWAHLDIAGTAWKEGTAKGATGRPVGLLVQFLLERAKTAA